MNTLVRHVTLALGQELQKQAEERHHHVEVDGPFATISGEFNLTALAKVSIDARDHWMIQPEKKK